MITKIQHLAVAGIVLLLAYLYLYPITSTNEWFVSHARIIHVYAMEMFKDSFDHGYLYPRWLPNLQGGYGYPNFIFTQPGFYFLTLPFTYLFTSIVSAFYASLFLITCIGGIGAYKLARLNCDRLASIVCMILFYTTPYLAINLFYRGDITEFSAMMLGPWPIYCFIRIADGIKNKYLQKNAIIGLIVSSFSIVMLHPLVPIYCVIPAFLMLAGKWVESGYNKKLISISGLCLLIVLTLSSPYWLTALQHKHDIHQGGVFLKDRVQNFSEFFSNGFYNIGPNHFIIALVGWLCAVRKNIFIRYVCVSYFLLLFLMTQYSDSIWHLDTPLKYTQFPWRINSVVATIQLMGIIQAVRWSSIQVKNIHYPHINTIFWSIASIVLLFTAMFHITFWPLSAFQIDFKEPYHIWGPLNYETEKQALEHKQFIYVGVYREFFPLKADYTNLPNRLLTDVPTVLPVNQDQSMITMNADTTDYLIHFSVTTPSPSGANDVNNNAILINQMYFPGWKIVINDQEVGESDSSIPGWTVGDHGRIRINLPAQGSYDIKAWYDGPPGWPIRNLSIILLLSMFVYMLRQQYKAYWIESPTATSQKQEELFEYPSPLHKQDFSPLILCCLCFVLILGAFLRFYHLTTLPPSLYYDEGGIGTNAMDIVMQGNPKVFYPLTGPGLYTWIIALFFYVMGDSLWTLRASVAVFGCLALGATWILSNELWRYHPKRYTLSLIATFLLATSFWHLQFSRLVISPSVVPFFEICSLWSVLVAIRERSWRLSALAGIINGIGVYNYWQYHIFMVLPVGLMLIHVYKVRADRRMLGAFAVPAILIALPLIYKMLYANIFHRIHSLSLLNTLPPQVSQLDFCIIFVQHVLKNVISTILMLFYRGDLNWRHNIKGNPELSIPAMLGLIVALGYWIATVRKWFNSNFKHTHSFYSLSLLLIWSALAMLPAVLTDEGVPHASRSIGMVVPLHILAGFGLYYIATYIIFIFSKYIPTAKCTQVIIVCICAFILIHSYTIFYTYFEVYGDDPKVKQWFSHSYPCKTYAFCQGHT